MEMSRQQDLWSGKNGRGRDSARSASFNAHYELTLRKEGPGETTSPQTSRMGAAYVR